MSPKPINFKPQSIDQKFLDLLQDDKNFKTKSELIRYCIHSTFEKDFGEGKYNQMFLEEMKIK